MSGPPPAISLSRSHSVSSRDMKFTESGVNRVYAARGPILNQFSNVQCAGFKVFSVSGHQPHAVCSARFDDRFCLLHGSGERLFAEDVLAKSRGLHAEIEVRSLRCSNVHSRNIWTRKAICISETSNAALALNCLASSQLSFCRDRLRQSASHAYSV